MRRRENDHHHQHEQFRGKHWDIVSKIIFNSQLCSRGVQWVGALGYNIVTVSLVCAYGTMCVFFLSSFFLGKRQIVKCKADVEELRRSTKASVERTCREVTGELSRQIEVKADADCCRQCCCRCCPIVFAFVEKTWYVSAGLTPVLRQVCLLR